MIIFDVDGNARLSDLSNYKTLGRKYGSPLEWRVNGDLINLRMIDEEGTPGAWHESKFAIRGEVLTFDRPPFFQIGSTYRRLK